MGWYDLTINNNGTFSYDIRRFNTTLVIKLTSTNNFIAIFKTDGLPSLNKSLISITKPTISSISDKPYSLSSSSTTFDFNGFGVVRSQPPIREGGCAVYELNATSPLGVSNNYFFDIQSANWSVGSLSWCPNGLSGWGDYNYGPEVDWKIHNFTGQGSSLKVWVK